MKRKREREREQRNKTRKRHNFISNKNKIGKVSRVTFLNSLKIV